MAARKPRTVGPAHDALPKAFDSLIVLDVDEVVLHFIDPFIGLLEECGARLDARDFKLTGSVHSQSTGAAMGNDELQTLMHRLYAEQAERQIPVSGVAEALSRLSRRADIIFLTAMAPQWHPARRTHLDAAGLHYPMIATERDKGAVIAELGQRWHGPIVFVDDLPGNLERVRRSAPATRLLHLMASSVFWPYLPALPTDVRSARDWRQAEEMIEALLIGK